VWGDGDGFPDDVDIRVNDPLDVLLLMLLVVGSAEFRLHNMSFFFSSSHTLLAADWLSCLSFAAFNPLPSPIFTDGNRIWIRTSRSRQRFQNSLSACTLLNQTESHTLTTCRSFYTSVGRVRYLPLFHPSTFFFDKLDARDREGELGDTPLFCAWCGWK